MGGTEVQVSVTGSGYLPQWSAKPRPFPFGLNSPFIYRGRAPVSKVLMGLPAATPTTLLPPPSIRRTS